MVVVLVVVYIRKLSFEPFFCDDRGSERDTKGTK